MSNRNYIKAAFVTAWRAVQVFIVIPASLIGTLLVGLAIMGEAPVESTVLAVYEWAETSVRPAPAGAVLVANCGNESASASGIKRPVTCNPAAPKVVPAADAAKAASDQLLTLYWCVVAISFGLLMVVRPGRQFFGVPNQA